MTTAVKDRPSKSKAKAKKAAKASPAEQPTEPTTTPPTGALSLPAQDAKVETAPTEKPTKTTKQKAEKAVSLSTALKRIVVLEPTIGVDELYARLEVMTSTHGLLIAER
jgi:hypothetical protein